MVARAVASGAPIHVGAYGRTPVHRRIRTYCVELGGSIICITIRRNWYNVSGSSASGEHELRTRDNPDEVQITVADEAGNETSETQDY